MGVSCGTHCFHPEISDQSGERGCSAAVGSYGVSFFSLFSLSIVVLVVDMDALSRLTAWVDSFAQCNLVAKGQVKLMCGFDVGQKVIQCENPCSGEQGNGQKNAPSSLAASYRSRDWVQLVSY